MEQQEIKKEIRRLRREQISNVFDIFKNLLIVILLGLAFYQKVVNDTEPSNFTVITILLLAIQVYVGKRD